MGVDGRRWLPIHVQQLSRHAEVNQENATAFEPNNQILAAAIERGDPLSLELGGHSGGVEGPGEAWVRDLDALQAPSDEFGLELCPDSLDLRQLGHGSSLVPLGRLVTHPFRSLERLAVRRARRGPPGADWAARR